VLHAHLLVVGKPNRVPRRAAARLRVEQLRPPQPHRATGRLHAYLHWWNIHDADPAMREPRRERARPGSERERRSGRPAAVAPPTVAAFEPASSSQPSPASSTAPFIGRRRLRGETQLDAGSPLQTPLEAPTGPPNPNLVLLMLFHTRDGCGQGTSSSSAPRFETEESRPNSS